MKRLLLVAAALPVVWVLSCHRPAEQTTAGDQRRQDLKQSLWKVEHEWAGAVQHGQAEVLNRILAEEYEYTGPQGEGRTKRQVIELIKSGDLKISSFGLIDIKVRQYGTVALVNFRAAWNGTSRRIDLSTPFRVTDVFVTREGRWQCVSRQMIRIQSPANEEKTP